MINEKAIKRNTIEHFLRKVLKPIYHDLILQEKSINAKTFVSQ